MLSQLESNPSIGISLANPTDVTPGIAASLSAISFLHSRDAFRLRHQRIGNGDSQQLEDARASVNPGSTVRNAWNVRIIKPALTSSTSAIAT